MFDSPSRPEVVLDWKPGCFPFRKTVDESTGSPPACAQYFYCAIGVDAVGASAVRDILLGLGELTQPALKLVHRHRNRAGDVTRRIFVDRARVDHDDLARARSFEQLFHTNRFWFRSVAEVVADQTLDLGEPGLSGNPKRPAQLEDGL